MFNRKRNLLSLCSLVIMAIIMSICVGCNTVNDDIIILNDNEVISDYKTINDVGKGYTVSPNIRFATKRKIKSIELIGYEAITIEGIKCHNISFDMEEEVSETSYSDYFIYNIVLKPIVKINSKNVGYEKILINNYEFKIDNKVIKFNQNYYLSLFENKTDIIDSFAGSAVGNRFDFITVRVEAKTAIDLKCCRFVDDAIIIEKGIINGQFVSIDELMLSFPKKLNAGECWTFSLSCRLKENIISGSGFFILSYSLDDGRIFEAPFGFMFLNYDWESVAKKLLD